MQVYRKLKALKGPLRSLNKLHFSHIASRAADARDALAAAQLELERKPSASTSNIAHLRHAALRLSEAESKFYFQKAKCRYVINSDQCTKVFHSIVRRNAKRNFIVTVSRSDGSVTSSTYEVAREFVDFYRGLLGTAEATTPVNFSVFDFGPLVQLEHLVDIELVPSETEIRDALFSIGDDKSPGPDGYTSCFFRKSWQTVGVEVCEAVREFFISGRLLRQLNHTVITLLPKSAHSSSVGDFRPIACCSVLYKVIAKILSAKIIPLLPIVINDAQAAFIEGRSMTESIHLAQELIRQYNRKRTSPRALIKVDLKKAYDSISWEFLHSVLIGLGFPLVLRG